MFFLKGDAWRIHALRNLVVFPAVRVLKNLAGSFRIILLTPIYFRGPFSLITPEAFSC